MNYAERPLVFDCEGEYLVGVLAAPDAPNAVPNLLVFEPFTKKRKASWLVNDAVPHSFTYTPDAAQGLVQLAERESAWNQTWHVPTTPNPLTGKEFVALAAKEFGVAPKYRVLSRPMLRLAGWFDPLVAESYEMLYQSDSPYLFDSEIPPRVWLRRYPVSDGLERRRLLQQQVFCNAVVDANRLDSFARPGFDKPLTITSCHARRRD